jgi:SAM-dependent methyltransferase
MPKASVDYVIMLKSLHHVPVDLMRKSLTELHRVLKPGGLAYLSEPIFSGAFNDILRLFHDEEHVRAQAFASVKAAVEAGEFELLQQIFFKEVIRFRGFAEFEERVIGVTHSTFNIDAGLRTELRSRIESCLGGDGIAEFHAPQRVDLLTRPR